MVAIKAALTGEPTAAERAWIDRIEQTRAELERSKILFEDEDFGMGKQAKFGDESQTTTRSIGTMTLLSSKPQRWAYLLFRLIRELKPKSGLELGACVGISAAYQAAALDLNGSGRLVSLEGARTLAETSTHTLKELGLDDRASVRVGRFTETITAALADLEPLQWAFIDGHHDEVATLQYMEEILQHAADQAVFVFDDINWSGGMQRAWAQIVGDDRFGLTVDLHVVGIAVVGGAHRAITLSYA